MEFKLLTHGDEIEITKENQALARLYKGKGDSTFDVTTRLKYMIQSVKSWPVFLIGLIFGQ